MTSYSKEVRFVLFYFLFENGNDKYKTHLTLNLVFHFEVGD